MPDQLELFDSYKHVSTRAYVNAHRRAYADGSRMVKRAGKVRFVKESQAPQEDVPQPMRDTKAQD